MSSINVNRNVADLFYRYKMPRICAKVEGKGNGIKTVLVNMPEVAKALSRPADYITKYFGCELGAQTQFDFKNERFIVNGSHDIAKLQVLLDGFIRKFVLCPDCDNPETELMVSTKRNTISQVCRACGYHGLLNFNHKLNTYILKNPPRTDPLALGSSLTEGYRSQRSKRSQTTIYRGGKKTESETLTSPELFPIRITHCRGSQTEDDESWTADISAAAVRARMQDLSVGAKTIALTEDTEKNEKKRMDLFYAFIKQRISEPTRLPEILREAERLDVKSKAPLILFELLIRPAHIAADIRTHRALLLSFTLSDTRAQRSALYALDAMCADKKSLITKIPALLKLLYDEDIVEENSIVEWAAKPSRKFAPRDVSTEVRQKAEPFLKWLSEADEEDSDVTEDGSGADFDNGSRKRVVATKTPSTKETVNKDESDVELDIDAI